jgi:uncharacterized repeat protein (TIGR02543 family)
MLVLALVMGCFAVMPPANAAQTFVTSQAALEAIPYNDAGENIVYKSDATGVAINGQTNLVRLYWWYDDTGGIRVYLMARSGANNKAANFAIIDEIKSEAVYCYAPGSNNPTYSIIKFTGITFDETSLVTVDTGSGGNDINKGKLSDYFTLIYLRYHDENKDGKTEQIHSVARPSSKDAPGLITIEAPSEFGHGKVGYTFTGWSSDSNPLIRVPHSDYATGKTVSQTTDLYATWSIDTYDITYVNVEGATNNNPGTYTIEDTPLTLNNPSKPGYNFVQWKEGNTIAAGSTGPRTFTAVWSDAIEYKITYNLDGGVNHPDNPSKYTIEETPLTLNDPVKAQHAFTGWEATGVTLVGEDGNVIPEGTVGDLVLTATFERNVYVVAFNPGGKGHDVDFVEYTQDVFAGESPKPETPKAELGYKFVGWTSDGGVKVYAPKDYRYPDELVEPLPPVEADITYTALWAKINEKQSFPDKLPSEVHFDQWMADYGVICVSSSTTKDGNYEVYFADWFFNVYSSCKISFGSNANKFDYEIVFTQNDKGELVAKIYECKTGKELDINLNCGQFEVVRDGKYVTKEKGYDYAKNFGGEWFEDEGVFKLFGCKFDNPFGSGAKLAWLGP